MEVDGGLVVKKLQMEDSGMFQCFATNGAGEESLNLWLRVKSEYSFCVLLHIHFFHTVN